MDIHAIDKRLKQGWVLEKTDCVDDCVKRIKFAKAEKNSTTIAFHGSFKKKNKSYFCLIPDFLYTIIINPIQRSNMLLFK